jgi:hypothetical protein|tara:strand:+ start:453 stop:935 length:483 start_codon:yes stop_codon:yes gene_type:complete
MGEDNMWSEDAKAVITMKIPECNSENESSNVESEKGDVVIEECSKSTSEELRDFGTGATRSKDADAERYDLISPYALRRVATIMAEGAKTHGEANWEKGVPLDATLNHLERHLQLWKMEQKSGKKIDSDDHMAKVIWGAMAICHYEEVGPINRGHLTPSK